MNDTPSPKPIAPEARPRLPRGVRLVHNEAQGGWVLLAPERVFKADPIAAEIVKRCTGEATFAAIVDELATTLLGIARAHSRRRDGAAARACRQAAPGIVTTNPPYPAYTTRRRKRVPNKWRKTARPFIVLSVSWPS